MSEYSPHARNKEILSRAFQMVQEVSYRVSARWLFYRLLQEGYYGAKDDYDNKFLPATSKARHAFYNGWFPGTLADETRKPVIRGQGEESVQDWLKSISENGVVCELDKWNNQDHYVEVWFEARAMTAQFEQYTKHITLRPMAGQPSIPFKWEIAKDIEERKEIVILYFGDLDPSGEIIGDTVERDVRKWSKGDFTFIRCGLTQDQVDLYDVPENPDKPGEFQWEAVPDLGAREIIESSVSPFIRVALFSEKQALENEAENWLIEQMGDLVSDWEADSND